MTYNKQDKFYKYYLQDFCLKDCKNSFAEYLFFRVTPVYQDYKTKLFNYNGVLVLTEYKSFNAENNIVEFSKIKFLTKEQFNKIIDKQIKKLEDIKLC